jgi:pyridoxamine 5'-phosphate oxidase
MEKDPIKRFHASFSRARDAAIELCDAAALATVGEDDHPTVRMVLLKEADERGFVFYTNLDSRKGREIANNPNVTLCFWWPPLQEQVRVEGAVVPVGDAEADAYFATRDRESQIGAWASKQSSKLGSLEELRRAFNAEAKRFEGRDVARPPNWSGFRLVPERIEFWLGRPHRLHERYLYTRRGDGWVITMLHP